ncbi:MAG: phosphatidylserine decarboxylase [Candidatus Thiodiazotropha sp.]
MATKGFFCKFCFVIVSSILFFTALPASAGTSPCQGSLDYLKFQYDNDPVTRKAFDKVYKELVDLPVGYSYGHSRENPWKTGGNGKGLYEQMSNMFETWCTALPQIRGDSDNALDPILYFAWFYYKNQAGQDFVQGRNPLKPSEEFVTGMTFLSKWSNEYLDFMNSKDSRKYVEEWVKDPRIEIDDYVKTKAIQYKSWNEFFARNLKSDKSGNYPSRPVTMPERDYVIVSPTDCIMNPLVQIVKTDGTYHRQYIDNPLQLNTVLDVKDIPISVDDMLGSVPDDIKEKFVGGSGLTCVLMPNTYHHFHAPVDGTVIHAEVVKTGTMGTPGTFGYSDFPNWVPLDGNVGRPGTDFSQFQAYQRGVIVIKVEYDGLAEGNKKREKKTGYVASIPVGLDSVGSVVLNTCDSKITDHVNCFNVGGPVTKGKTKLGNFFFGGSLDILLFSEGMISPAVQTRMGNQIGVINIGKSPKSPWSLD